MANDTNTKEGGNRSRVAGMRGVVVSSKMKDTIVVSVNRFVKHPRYEKFIRKTKRYKVHDPGNTARVGDTVTIIPCRPISKEKHFRILTNERSEKV